MHLVTARFPLLLFATAPPATDRPLALLTLVVQGYWLLSRNNHVLTLLVQGYWLLSRNNHVLTLAAV